MTAVSLSTYAVILFLHAKLVIMFMFPNLKLINYQYFECFLLHNYRLLQNLLL